MSDGSNLSLDTGYESELTAGREEIASVLTGVTDGVLDGTIELGSGDKAIEIHVPDDLSLEIEFEVEADEMGLELELEWPAPEAGLATPDTDQQTGAGDEKETEVIADSESQSSASFEIFQDQKGEWRWRLRHRNGDIIAACGEGYTQKHNAKKGLQSVMKNAPDAGITEISSD